MKWLAFILVVASAGCVRTRYVPTERTNYAFALVDGGTFVHVNRPQVKAFEMTLPFTCDQRLVDLATGAMLPPAPDSTIDEFSGLSDLYGAEVYRVLTHSGPNHDIGPSFVVISGTRRLDAAVSALNVVHRYNDVAECVRRLAGGSP